DLYQSQAPLGAFRLRHITHWYHSLYDRHKMMAKRAETSPSIPLTFFRREPALNDETSPQLGQAGQRGKKTTEVADQGNGRGSAGEADSRCCRRNRLSPYGLRGELTR